MTLTNNSGELQTITWCVADHWGEYGDHDAGDYGDCRSKVVAVPVGAYFAFDETEDNGNYIHTAALAAGLG